jgi:hypothetical protein
VATSSGCTGSILATEQQTTEASGNLNKVERSLTEVNMSETELLSLAQDALEGGKAVGGGEMELHNGSKGVGYIGLDEIVEYFGIGGCGGEEVGGFTCTPTSYEEFSFITDSEEPLRRRTFHTEDRWPI